MRHWAQGRRLETETEQARRRRRDRLVPWLWAASPAAAAAWGMATGDVSAIAGAAILIAIAQCAFVASMVLWGEE